MIAGEDDTAVGTKELHAVCAGGRMSDRGELSVGAGAEIFWRACAERADSRCTRLELSTAERALIAEQLKGPPRGEIALYGFRGGGPPSPAGTDRRTLRRAGHRAEELAAAGEALLPDRSGP